MSLQQCLQVSWRHSYIQGKNRTFEIWHVFSWPPNVLEIFMFIKQTISIRNIILIKTKLRNDCDRGHYHGTTKFQEDIKRENEVIEVLLYILLVRSAWWWGYFRFKVLPSCVYSQLHAYWLASWFGRGGSSFLWRGAVFAHPRGVQGHASLEKFLYCKSIFLWFEAFYRTFCSQ